jgi:AraC-like DNA-binding protein
MPLQLVKVRELQNRFAQRLASRLAFVDLFNDVPGVECYVKDTEGRRIRVSEGIWKRLGMPSEAAMIGKTDHQLFPPHIADQYASGDRQVIASRLPLTGLVEVWIDEQGAFDWFLSNKYPLFDASGDVMGIMGTLRKAAGIQKSALPDSPLSRVVNHIRQRFREPSPMDLLSKVAGLSERQLRRRFQAEFGIGLNAFLIKTRVHAAAELLVRGDQSIADISLEVGFCDQSAFTRSFRERLGMTPRQYRIHYRENPRPKSHSKNLTESPPPPNRH